MQLFQILYFVFKKLIEYIYVIDLKFSNTIKGLEFHIHKYFKKKKLYIFVQNGN